MENNTETKNTDDPIRTKISELINLISKSMSDLEKEKDLLNKRNAQEPQIDYEQRLSFLRGFIRGYDNALTLIDQTGLAEYKRYG